MIQTCGNCEHRYSEGGYPCDFCNHVSLNGTGDDLWEMANDMVNHPKHYTSGKIEVADFIADQKLNFDRGNAVKYIVRAGKKDEHKEIEDLEKAKWYIDHEIKMLKEGEK